MEGAGKMPKAAYQQNEFFGTLDITYTQRTHYILDIAALACIFWELK